MLAESIVQKLNQQVEKEAFASSNYLSLASWAESRNLDGIAGYFYKSAEDERSHMLEIFRYINANGGLATAPVPAAPRLNFDNLLQIFEFVFELEHGVTLAINELAGFALDSRDFATFQFLQPFIKEQQEAEASVNQLVFMIRTVGYDERNLYFINKTFRKSNQA